MSTRHVVDNRSSPPASWKPHGLIVKRELWFSYNAAKTRVGRDGDEKDPLEWESTNLWEDLYHHYLLRGYCNNSQIAPHDTSTKRCDIVTRYYDANGRKTMLFTEVKRANRAEATTGIADAETQVLEYCSAYLKAQGSRDKVYACAAIGPFIRCFLVRYPSGTTSGSKGAQPALFDLCDLLRGGTTTPSDQVDVAKSTIKSYKDAGDDNHANDIRRCFTEIKRLGDPPFAASSRSPSASSSTSRSASVGNSNSAPASGSPMSGILANNAGRSTSQESSEAPRRHQSTDSVSSGHGRPGVQGAVVGTQTPEQH
ncbi:hypothetical protein LA080_000495 [Diaporthe eres]|nr:hypothetical protein LA080_000495 [Diaporthe eres]